MKLKSVGVVALSLALAATPALLASGGEEVGNVCVQDYQPGAVCTANDVRIEEFIELQVLEACDQGIPNELEIQFRVLVSAQGSPDRWDVGIFLDLSGSLDGAKTGDNCLHDFLPPPLTPTPVYGDANNDAIPDILNGPWLDNDGDLCGDMDSNTQILKDLITVRIPCVDNDSDGFVDLHGCASWDNNANSVCNDVTGAFPGTNSKCGCGTIATTQMVPIPVDLIQFEVE